MFLFKKDSGFTLIELLVTVGIFVFMTALVVANYGSFNDGTLLTSMSYDVALAMRGAQSYGLNVKGATSGTSQNFNYPYGMDFNLSTPSTQSQMILFADSYPYLNNVYGDGICTDGTNGNNNYCKPKQNAADAVITTYTLARGGLVKSFCVGPSESNCSTPNNAVNLDITFRRPDPNAIIEVRDNGGHVMNNGSVNTWPYAKITVENASKTSTRSIVVNETGLIAVQNQ